MVRSPWSRIGEKKEKRFQILLVLFGMLIIIDVLRNKEPNKGRKQTRTYRSTKLNASNASFYHTTKLHVKQSKQIFIDVFFLLSSSA